MKFPMIKKLVLVSIYLLAVPATVMHAATPNPADFSVVVHVVYSRAGRTDGVAQQELQVAIGGQQLELAASLQGILQPGDYKARYIDLNGKHPNGYDYAGEYEFLLPDGKTRVYTVTGLGPRDDSAGGSTPPVVLHP